MLTSSVWSTWLINLRINKPKTWTKINLKSTNTWRIALTSRSHQAKHRKWTSMAKTTIRWQAHNANTNIASADWKPAALPCWHTTRRTSHRSTDPLKRREGRLREEVKTSLFKMLMTRASSSITWLIQVNLLKTNRDKHFSQSCSPIVTTIHKRETCLNQPVEIPKSSHLNSKILHNWTKVISSAQWEVFWRSISIFRSKATNSNS